MGVYEQVGEVKGGENHFSGIKRANYLCPQIVPTDGQLCVIAYTKKQQNCHWTDRFSRELCNCSSEDSHRKSFIDMDIHMSVCMHTQLHRQTWIIYSDNTTNCLSGAMCCCCCCLFCFFQNQPILTFSSKLQTKTSNWNRRHCILIEGDIRHSFCWILPLSKSEARNARKETQNWLWHAYPWETENLHFIFKLAEMSL